MWSGESSSDLRPAEILSPDVVEPVVAGQDVCSPPMIFKVQPFLTGRVEARRAKNGLCRLVGKWRKVLTSVQTVGLSEQRQSPMMDQWAHGLKVLFGTSDQLKACSHHLSSLIPPKVGLLTGSCLLFVYRFCIHRPVTGVCGYTTIQGRNHHLISEVETFFRNQTSYLSSSCIQLLLSSAAK